MLDTIPPPVQIAVGVTLILLGISFTYKAFMAMIRGKLRYWDGFLPFTIVSPFIVHLPSSKKSLIKETEGLWIHMLMGPIFMFTAILCICAGCDLLELPGTETLNLVLNGGKVGNDKVTFSKHSGYRFPIVNKAGPVLMKLFSTQAGLNNKEKLTPDNQGSLNDAMNR